jgi:hypothetical protein
VGEKQGFVEQEVKKILLVTDFLHFFGQRKATAKPGILSAADGRTNGLFG